MSPGLVWRPWESCTMKLPHFLSKPVYSLNLIRIITHPHKHPPFLLHVMISSSRHYSFLYPETVETVNKLVSIFTQQEPPFSPVTKQELAQFGSKLNPKVVEATLKTFKNWETALRFFNWASTQNGYRHNCYTYNALASILSGARQNAAMKALYMDLISSRCVMTPGALGFAVRCLGCQGMVAEANEFFDQVTKLGLCDPNDYSYNSLLEVVSKSGWVELMAARLNEMMEKGWGFDRYTLTSVLQCYCRAGKFERALEVFNQIRDFGWMDSHVFTILLLSYMKGGEMEKAFYLIEMMEELNISLNEKTFYVLIHGFVKETREDYAIHLLDKMKSLGFVPGISLYAVLIEGLCKKGEVMKALPLYSQMKEMGIHPDVKLLTVLLSSLPDTKEMTLLLKEAKGHLSNKSMLSLLNAALNSLVSCGLSDKAYHLLKEIMNDDAGGDPELGGCVEVETFVSPDATSVRIVIDGLCQKDKLDMALSLFHDMDRIGYKRSLLLYNNLINALSNANRVEECHELLAEMKELGFMPSQFTHNSILEYYCRREDVVGAINMVKEMCTHGHQPWIKHYTLLVKKLCTNRRAVEACTFLDMMVQEGFVPDMIAYSVAIDGLIKIEELDHALKLFREICAHGHCPDVVAYNTVMHGLCKAKRLLEAQDVYNEMVQKGLIPSVVSYNLLIDAWCKEGDIDRAVGLFSRMDGKGREPNVVTYTTLIDGLFNAGRPDEALLLWSQMLQKGCFPNKIAFMALIHGLCKCRKPDTAFIYFQLMEEKQMMPHTYVYVALVEAFLADSNAPMALDILRKMIQHEKFPDSLDKNSITLRAAVLKLSDDTRTSLNMNSLIADGSIPVHLLQTEGGL